MWLNVKKPNPQVATSKGLEPFYFLQISNDQLFFISNWQEKYETKETFPFRYLLLPQRLWIEYTIYVQQIIVISIFFVLDFLVVVQMEFSDIDKDEMFVRLLKKDLKGTGMSIVYLSYNL